jgi:hypothetical protein
MTDFNLHTLSTTSVILALGSSLLAGVFVSYLSALLLWLTPAQKLMAFLIGFALTCTLAITEIYQPGNQWKDMLMLRSLPLLASFIYFLPTVAAIAVDCKIFRSVFLVNLFFGWTVIGWVTAILMALRPEERDIYGDLTYRLTPFGVVSRAAIAYDPNRLVNRVNAAPYVPVLRREL